jgi:hypothetical protein
MQNVYLYVMYFIVYLVKTTIWVVDPIYFHVLVTNSGFGLVIEFIEYL